MDPCPSTNTTDRCETYRGGRYKPDASSTFSSANDRESAGAPPENSPVTDSRWGTDLFNFNSSLIPKFPFSSPYDRLREGDEALNAIGLGRNSSILEALMAAGTISSRSWGLFWGHTGVDAPNQADGTLVLGGYDEAKTSGPNITRPFNDGPGCTLIVTVTDLIMNLPNGTDHSIMPDGDGSAMKVCISARGTALSLPQNIWRSFRSVATPDEAEFDSRSVGIGFWGVNYPIDNV
jgi:hypothetical protein